MKKATVRIAGTKIRYTFKNGGRVELDVAKLAPEVILQLAVHGAKQKMNDSHAGISDPAEAAEHARAVASTLRAGNFYINRRAEEEGWLASVAMAAKSGRLPLTLQH